MFTRNLLSASLLFFTAFLSARAEVTLAGPFSDHVVLQRNKPVPIWGKADPGEHVSVTFHDQTIGTTASQDGRWVLFLDPLPAITQGTDLVVTGKNTIRVSDVVVGDVWLCSGQSNMEFPVSRGVQAFQEINAADFPLIRHFKVARAVAETPSETVGGQWTLCSSSTAGDFTAVGFFFARDIFQRTHVPIGLINSTVGGTQIESWMGQIALQSNAAFNVVEERWKKTLADYPERKKSFDEASASWAKEQAAAAAAQPKPLPFTKPKPSAPATVGHPDTPAGLFNGMIHPWLPYALTGVLWYQGESNTSRPDEYHALFAAMITSWRSLFGQRDLPFYWVQLPNYKNGNGAGTDFARLREAQAQTLTLPYTAQAVTVDIGDPDDIHPRDKQEVGRRLALIARAKIYEASVDYSGPVFERALPEGSTLRLFFRYADSALTARDKPLQSFQIAGADKKFYPATARIDRATVIVSAPEVKKPVAVRYGWANDPGINFYNGAGLPATPFRTDKW